MSLRWQHIDGEFPAYSARTGSPVISMSFGFYGEIFCRFADGTGTCVMPTGEPIFPHKCRLSASWIEAEGHDPEEGHGAKHESPVPKADAQ